ncbi:flagellar basal-body MS-ring/collar protein FliF [Planctomicrobium sp. SH668]|uniref:flagellar basal-body MS-ring/collar protein FliF n=1 Tax=Planctomicrobium sp. SH668 TaxID=3448126 RepID=UPI003F5C32DF
MDFFNKFSIQIQSLWGRWSVGQRAAMIASVVASIATVSGVGIWATTPEYVAATDRLSPQQAAEVVSALEAEGIQYKLNYAGSAVSVPKNSLSRARLALKDLVGPAAGDAADISEGIWSDPTLYKAKLNRQLETRLGRSIMNLGSVRNATVHLTPGESSPFLRDRTSAKASVILELQPGAMFSATDGRAIASLVAHSVENLSPENVSILDTSGRMLTSAMSGMEGDVTGQLSYRSRVEADLASKAEAILTQMLGAGRAVVRVTADIDFTDTKTKETKYDPDAKVKISETIHSESTTGSRQTKGIVGQPPEQIDQLAFKAGGSSAPSTKMESNTTQYETAKTEDTVHKAPGRINRLTIAAVVQLPESAADAGSTGAAQAPTITSMQIEKIIKQAVGFDANRMDEIEVLSAPLTGNAHMINPVIAVPGWEKYAPLLQNISLGLGALVSLFLGVLVIRRMQPVVVETGNPDAIPPEVVLKKAELAQRAIQNPEAVAEVIRAWLGEATETRSSISKAS